MTAGDQKGTSFRDMLIGVGRLDESMPEKEDEEGNSEQDEEQTVEDQDRTVS